MYDQIDRLINKWIIWAKIQVIHVKYKDVEDISRRSLLQLISLY